MSNRQVFRDVLPALNAALEHRTVLMDLGTHAAAVAFSHRIHRYRAAERRENTKIYKPGEPAYGTSAYDCLKVAVRDTHVHIEVRDYVVPLSIVDAHGNAIDIQEYIDIQRMIDGTAPIGSGDPTTGLDATDDDQ